MDEDKFEDIEIHCPYCNKSQSQRIWCVIEHGIDNEQEEKMIDGTFFERVCPHCGKEYQVRHQSVYINDEKNVMIAFSEDPVEVMNFEQKIRNLGCQAGNATDDADRFIEKVRLSLTELDPRIVEIIKYAFLQSLPSESEGEINKIICVPYDDHLQINYFMDGIAIIRIPLSAYKKIKKELSPQMQRYEKDHGNTIDQIIDMDWAIQFLDETEIDDEE